MPFKAVIFDLFGTLVDNFPIAPYKALLAEMAAGMSAPAADFAHRWTATRKDRFTGQISSLEDNLVLVCTSLGISVDSDGPRRAAGLRRAFEEIALTPRADAVLTLEAVKALGLPVGLVSNCDWEVPAVWREHPFSRHVDVPVFSWIEKICKPAPAIYLRCCERLNVEPRDCLYVDDSAHSLLGASQVGMTTIRILAKHESAETHQVDKQPWEGPVVSSLSEVLGHL